MSVAAGPFTLTDGLHLALTVPPPGTGFTHVVLYNQSSLYLELNGKTLWLPPWTADIYELAAVGYPVRAVVAGSAGISGLLLATFFTIDEIPANAVYPLALPPAASAPADVTPRVYAFEFAWGPGVTGAISAQLTCGPDTAITGLTGNVVYYRTAPDPAFMWGQIILEGFTTGRQVILAEPLIGTDVSINASRDYTLAMTSPINITNLLKQAGAGTDAIVRLRIRLYIGTAPAPYTPMAGSYGGVAILALTG